MKNPVVIHEYDAEVDIAVAKAILDGHGIEHVFESYNAAGMRPMVYYAQGVRLIVDEVDADRARDVLGL